MEAFLEIVLRVAEFLSCFTDSVRRTVGILFAALTVCLLGYVSQRLFGWGGAAPGSISVFSGLAFLLLSSASVSIYFFATSME